MSARLIGVLTAVTMLAGLVGSASAHAAPLDKGHFHDTSSQAFTCDTTPATQTNDVSGNFVFNFHGTSPFPYYRESVHGTVVYTDLNNGGTFTNVFTSNTADVQISDNGDGTITITDQSSGGSRYYDTHGKLVLNDPGQTRFSFRVDYNGTPGDPSDDVEVPGSFQIVRDSTGRNDTQGRDFCQDLATFSSS